MVDTKTPEIREERAAENKLAPESVLGGIVLFVGGSVDGGTVGKLQARSELVTVPTQTSSSSSRKRNRETPPGPVPPPPLTTGSELKQTPLP